MDNKVLEKLVKDYKKRKDRKILDEVFKMLQSVINKKVEFLYFKLKGFNIEQKDIQQELYIKIMEIIKNYNVKESFEKYFFTSIWTWQPKLQEEDIIEHESLSKIGEDGEKMETNIEDTYSKKPDINLIIEDILNECKTENEKKICQMYLENPNISEEKIGKNLKITHQAISKILLKLRKRLTKRGIK